MNISARSFDISVDSQRIPHGIVSYRRVNDKLMLSGAVYKDFYSFNSHSMDQNFKMPETQGMILNLNYRPTHYLEINAAVEYGNRSRSMLQSPFNYGGMLPGAW